MSASSATETPVVICHVFYNGVYSTVNDDVTVEGLTIASQTIGVVDQSNGLTGLDGILGLGPDDLTLNSIVALWVLGTIVSASLLYQQSEWL